MRDESTCGRDAMRLIDCGSLAADETNSMWRYRIGRSLQFLGLLILPFAIASELVGEFGLGQSMLVAAAGAGLFYVGFLVQNRPEPSSRRRPRDRYADCVFSKQHMLSVSTHDCVLYHSEMESLSFGIPFAVA